MAEEQDLDLLSSIRDGMEVTDRAGTRIGTVRGVEGGHFKIDRVGQEPRNQIQYLSPDLVYAINEDRVVLNRSWDELRRMWSESDYAERHERNPSV